MCSTGAKRLGPASFSTHKGRVQSHTNRRNINGRPSSCLCSSLIAAREGRWLSKRAFSHKATTSYTSSREGDAAGTCKNVGSIYRHEIKAWEGPKLY